MTPDQPPANVSAEDLEWQEGLGRLSRDKLNEQLCQATENNDLWRVRAALAAGADVHTGGEQPLRRAAVSGFYRVAKALVEAGANLHVNDEEPLCWASRAGNTALVEYFLACGAAEKSWGGRRARDWALDYDRETTVALIDEAADLRNRMRKTGESLSEGICALVDRGDPLPLEDIKKGGVRAEMFMLILGDAGKLDRLFEPKDWAGKTDALAQLWQRIPKKYQDQVDLSAKIAGANAQALKARKPPKFKIGP